ncbi:hypothetical protein [Clostridium beijerinckii]|uniref:hypothetical protein n=1 Tax=Clostridium beijerinckii TaxID=1520 RepID=UPI0015714783|nr:hypothetical protein [Clostridium beijerinckii]NRU52600.1 hypothetical protein [Clostridium beijerinckii]NYC68643.1 hypothetical protein [Clostridium beijerinckii]
MKKVFLENLPRKIYKNKECIDWESAYGHKVKFIYDSITGYFTIGCYTKPEQLLEITCNIYNIKRTIYTSGLMACKITNTIDMIKDISKVKKYLKICKQKGVQLTNMQRKYYGFSQKILTSGCKYIGYESITDLQNRNSINKIKRCKYSYGDILISHREFFNKYDRFPVNSDYNNKVNMLVPKEKTVQILRENKMTYEDLFKHISNTNMSIEEYEYNKTINNFKDICIKENKVISVKLLQEKIGHDLRWISNRNTNIKSYYDFYSSFGFKKECDLNKKEVIKIIYKMQSKLDRPLMYNDFRDSDNFDEIGILSIRKHFGTMNQMKEELGLEINQEDMISKHVDDFDILVRELQFVCDIVEKDDRNIVTSKDINSINRLNINYQSFQKRCLENNTSVRSVIDNYGFELQKEGNGLVYSFNDGERTVSQYELNFSNKLREYGYLYNKDYFRDVRYKEFINYYNDMMNCDYVIHIDNKAIYIELAGMLSGKNETKYKQNIDISSKSKQLYAEKLKLKENMLIQNGLNYFILFPSDLSENDLDFLFENKLNICRKDLI